MLHKKIYNRTFLAIAIVVSFLLAIMDMFFLKEVFERYFYFPDWGGALSALALATAANISALLWGKQKGERESGKGFLWGWILLGIAYFVLRLIPFYNEVIAKNTWELKPIIEHLGRAIILAISYIGTGTMIEWAASQLWDIDIVNYLKTKNEFESQNAIIANNRSAVLKMVEDLENFDNNYKILDKQYDKCVDKIFKYDEATINMTAGKTKRLNLDIDPEEVDKIVNRVLENRRKNIEKSHNK